MKSLESTPKSRHENRRKNMGKVSSRGQKIERGPEYSFLNEYSQPGGEFSPAEGKKGWIMRPFD